MHFPFPNNYTTTKVLSHYKVLSAVVNLSDPYVSSLYRCWKQTFFKEKEDGLYAKNVLCLE